MEKIQSLTEEQLAQIPAFVKKWLDIGLSSEPVNFEKAKESICLAYNKVGLKSPTKFLVAKGPLDAIRIIKEIDPNNTDSFKILNEMIYGNLDVSWISFYAYFQEIVGVKNCDILDGLKELSKYSGWVSVYEDVVIFQDRPEYIKMDERNLLHSETGPSIHYRDGLSVYSWHGIRIPSDWIENKLSSLTPAIAITWPNIEQRRAACEILGWARILRELNSVVIDNDYDPQIGTLLEVDIPDIGKEKFLKVLCGTGREFAIPVPPEMKTALEANAWTFNIDPNMLLDLEVRT